MLAEEDRVLIKEVPPAEIQAWCLARISEYQNRNQRLRESRGSAARNAICEAKTYIRALRSEYNVFSPINLLLPPEVLMEIFSNVHPAVTSRRRVPVLLVCRYWRKVIFKTPQFWANLLSLPIWNSLNLDRNVGRFKAALVQSAPESFALSLPFRSLDVVDVLTPHTSRVSSLTFDSMSDDEVIKPLLGQHMPRLTHLVILDCSRSLRSLDDPPTLYFHNYPDIRTLQLQLTVFYSPAAPCLSLLHLKLAHCAIRAWPIDKAGLVHPLCSVHHALELFPNLETLSLCYSLSEGGWFGDLPEVTKTVHLPRLRHIEIEDIPTFIPRFLPHLTFPSTTSLVLEPAHRLSFEYPVAVPLFPGISPSPAPDAELSLFLDLQFSEGPARWETHGDGTRPVRVTLAAAARNLDTVAHFTRELANALAPGRGVTVLTAKGTWEYSATSGHPHINARQYWTEFLPNLGGLRRVVCATGGATKDFVDLLGRPLPGSSEFPCACLMDLALVWDLPPGACLELERESQNEAHADIEVSGERASLQGARNDRAGHRRLGSEVAASLRGLCDTLGTCLVERTGRCEPIRKLSVVLRGSYGGDIDVQGWQAVLVQRQLQDALGHLVGEVAVVDGVD